VFARHKEFYSNILEVIGDRELPDAQPYVSRRRLLKDLAHSFRPRFSACELAYLASAVEVEANLVRAAEETDSR
jgi:hypothetical protein